MLTFISLAQVLETIYEKKFFKLRTVDLYLPEAYLGLLLDTGNLLEFHPCQQVKFSAEGRTPKSRKMCPKKSEYVIHQIYF